MDGAVYSMTGFATGKLDTGITIDIRSVNSRFLDLSFKLPDALRHLESKLREVVGANMRRGKCEIRINYQPSTTQQGYPQLDTALVAHLLLLQTQVLSLSPQAPPLTVANLLSLSTQKGESNQDAMPDDASILSLMHTVLVDFSAARAAEGARLCTVMLTQLQALRELRDRVIPLVPALVEQQRQRFLLRFSEAVADSGGKVSATVAEERALTEATAFALRVDVTEEVHRLGSHLDEIESVLRKGATKQELGKRLDFLIQELHREANTLGSKSATLSTTQIAMDMKVLIEQLREQVQNIE